jgi:hypothetical protein
MFIDIIKVIEEKKRTKDGSPVIDPIKKTPVIEKLTTSRETIRIDEIKSARAWNKTKEQEVFIDGPMTKVYMFGDRTKKSQPEILIKESHESFSERLNAIKVREHVGQE